MEKVTLLVDQEVVVLQELVVQQEILLQLVLSKEIQEVVQVIPQKVEVVVAEVVQDQDLLTQAQDQVLAEQLLQVEDLEVVV